MMCNFIFQSDCQVQLQPQIIPPNMEEYVNSLLTAVLPSVLNKFRIYLTLLRLLDYSISDEVTKVWKISLADFQLHQTESALLCYCTCSFLSRAVVVGSSLKRKHFIVMDMRAWCFSCNLRIVVLFEYWSPLLPLLFAVLFIGSWRRLCGNAQEWPREHNCWWPAQNSACSKVGSAVSLDGRLWSKLEPNSFNADALRQVCEESFSFVPVSFLTR